MTNASQDHATDNEPKRLEECKNIHNRHSQHTVGPTVHVGDRYITSMGQQENKNIKWNARLSHHYTLQYILKHK